MKSTAGRQRGFVAIGHTPSGGASSRDRIADVGIVLALVAGAAMLGSDIYERFLLLSGPGASASHPLLELAGAGDGSTATLLRQYWLGVHLAVGATLIVALALNRISAWRCTTLLLAVGLLIALWIWGEGILRPELERILLAPASDASSAEIVRWGLRSRWREAGDAVFVLTLALSLAAPLSRGVSHTPRTVVYRRTPSR